MLERVIFCLIFTIIFILRSTDSCKKKPWYPKGYDKMENGEEDPKFSRQNLSNPKHWPKDTGWEEKTKKKPYTNQDYQKFVQDEEKKKAAKEKAAVSEAQKAAKEIGDPYDPNDPYNLGKEGVKGPQGPFGPDGPFGPKGPGPHFGPEGSGAIGDKGRWGPNGPPWKPPYGEYGPGGPFGDGYPYGKGSKWPAAWGVIGISPIQGILDGVPDDVDVHWPKDWKGIGLPNTGDVPPPHAKVPQSHKKADLCYLKPAVGDCDTFRLRWAYNPYLGDCQEFVWSGCGGNENNFVTKDRCREACQKAPVPHCREPVSFEDYIDWPKIEGIKNTIQSILRTGESKGETEEITTEKMTEDENHNIDTPQNGKNQDKHGTINTTRSLVYITQSNNSIRSVIYAPENRSPLISPATESPVNKIKAISQITKTKVKSETANVSKIFANNGDTKNSSIPPKNGNEVIPENTVKTSTEIHSQNVSSSNSTQLAIHNFTAKGTDSFDKAKGIFNGPNTVR